MFNYTLVLFMICVHVLKFNQILLTKSPVWQTSNFYQITLSTKTCVTVFFSYFADDEYSYGATGGAGYTYAEYSDEDSCSESESEGGSEGEQEEMEELREELGDLLKDQQAPVKK